MPPPPVPGPAPVVVTPPVAVVPPAPAPAPVAFTPPPPAAPQVQAAAAALTPVPTGLGAIRSVTGGDLYNDGTPVAIYATDAHLLILPSGGAPRIEAISGLQHVLLGDFDGDGTQELALFSDTHVWIMRFSQFGGIPSGKVALPQVPDHLTRAPFTHDSRAVLMSATSDTIRFYVLHPSKGLVEIGSTTVPQIDP